jgi:hypothetical protein
MCYFNLVLASFVIQFIYSFNVVFRCDLTTFNHLSFKFKVAFKCD